MLLFVDQYSVLCHKVYSKLIPIMQYHLQNFLICGQQTIGKFVLDLLEYQIHVAKRILFMVCLTVEDMHLLVERMMFFTLRWNLQNSLLPQETRIVKSVATPQARTLLAGQGSAQQCAFSTLSTESAAAC